MQPAAPQQAVLLESKMLRNPLKMQSPEVLINVEIPSQLLEKYP